MDLEIAVYNKSQIYEPGDHLNGEVKILLNGKSATSSGLEIEFSGVCSVLYKQEATVWNKDGTKLYLNVNNSNTEEYFSSSTFVYGDNSGKILLDLNGEDYSFPFDWRIPKHCPESFRLEYGWVVYSIVATLHIEGDEIPLRKILDITIKNTCDLSTKSDIFLPIQSTKVSRRNWHCFIFKDCNLTVKLLKRGFNIGESIYMSVQCANKTRRDFYDLKAKLYRLVIFRAKEHRKVVSTVLAEIRGPEVKKKSKIVWDGELLTIPHDALSNTIDVLPRIIRISYYIKVMVELTKWPHLSVRIPIGVGHVMQRVSKDPGNNSENSENSEKKE